MQSLRTTSVSPAGILLALLLCALLFLSGCEEAEALHDPVDPSPVIVDSEEPGFTVGDRLTSIPENAHKMMPEEDLYPPILHSDEWEEPVPLPYPVNTAGGEDSAFIMPDGNTLYVFFTPDVSVPVEKQLIDGVTGIYVSQKVAGTWSVPKRVILNDDISLDGCAYVRDNVIWFCTARAGYTGLVWFTAESVGGVWQNWRDATPDFPDEEEVGELHITADGSEMYFHSSQPGGQGGYDIWVARYSGGEWQPAEPVTVVNSPETDGWPFVSPDGRELWFTRFHQGYPALFRSVRTDGEWGEPELIVSQFAGEPTLDKEGNLYFTHHFYRNSVMLDADIYYAKKK